MIEFDSLNPYQNMEVIVADDPQSLLVKIKQIGTPITIAFMVPYGNRLAAYVLGDVRKNETRPKKTTKTSTGEK